MNYFIDYNTMYKQILLKVRENRWSTLFSVIILYRNDTVIFIVFCNLGETQVQNLDLWSMSYLGQFTELGK